METMGGTSQAKNGKYCKKHLRSQRARYRVHTIAKMAPPAIMWMLSSVPKGAEIHYLRFFWAIMYLWQRNNVRPWRWHAICIFKRAWLFGCVSVRCPWLMLLAWIAQHYLFSVPCFPALESTKISNGNMRKSIRSCLTIHCVTLWLVRLKVFAWG